MRLIHSFMLPWLCAHGHACSRRCCHCQSCCYYRSCCFYHSPAAAVPSPCQRPPPCCPTCVIRAAAEADGLRGHNLVRLPVFEHAVLVDAALMGKGVGSHNGLVGLWAQEVQAQQEGSSRDPRRGGTGWGKGRVSQAGKLKGDSAKGASCCRKQGCNILLVSEAAVGCPAAEHTAVDSCNCPCCANAGSAAVPPLL